MHAQYYQVRDFHSENGEVKVKTAFSIG
jgi:hypothetical protein